MKDINNNKQYLGDGVYTEFDGWGYWLTTAEGNRIYVEPDMIRELAKRLGRDEA